MFYISDGKAYAVNPFKLSIQLDVDGEQLWSDETLEEFIPYDGVPFVIVDRARIDKVIDLFTDYLVATAYEHFYPVFDENVHADILTSHEINMALDFRIAKIDQHYINFRNHLDKEYSGDIRFYGMDCRTYIWHTDEEMLFDRPHAMDSTFHPGILIFKDVLRKFKTAFDKYFADKLDRLSITELNSVRFLNMVCAIADGHPMRLKEVK